MTARRALAVLLLAPLLMASKCKKDKDDDKGDRIISDLPDPAMELQVAGIDPNYGPSGESFSAEVLGSGFEIGSKVSFAGTDAGQVSWKDSSTLALLVPALEPGYYDVTVSTPSGARSTLRKGLTITQSRRAGTGCGALTVTFGADSSALDEGPRAQVDNLVKCLLQGSTPVRVEGHCDERGTTDYNIALGQRRAESVARYMQGLGLPSTRIEVVSYGEERPVSAERGESAWGQNRRAEIVPRE
jgi:peptidoglycan-associated lipoprotein